MTFAKLHKILVFTGLLLSNQITYLHATQSEFGQFLNENGEEYVYESMGQHLAIQATKESARPDSTKTLIIRKVAKSGFKKAAFTVLGAFGVATIWYGAKSLWAFIDRQITKPTVIIKSKKPLFSPSKPNRYHRSLPAAPHNPLILSAQVQERIDHIAQTTKKTFEKIKEGTSNLKYRNLMLFGPSGNGKTSIATTIAESSGMEFAIVNAASFAKQGALEVLDDLFKWADKKRGLMLIIENADALIMQRKALDPASQQYKVLSSFLTYTSTRSDKWMIIFTTNRMDGIDPIIAQRIDDLVEIPLPTYHERFAALKAYRDHIFAQELKNDSIMQQLSDERLQEIAVQIDHSSYTDLEGFINSLTIDFETSQDKSITESQVKYAVSRLIEKNAFFNKASSSETQDLQPLSIEAKSLLAQFLEWLVAPRTVEPLF